jgi:putative membrane protein
MPASADSASGAVLMPFGAASHHAARHARCNRVPLKQGVLDMKILPILSMTLFATAAMAQSPATPPPAASPTMPQTAEKAVKAHTPQQLLEKLAQGGMTEVEAGKLAQTKGTAPGVKEFGEMMVEDHGAANEKVKALAASRNMTLPKTPSAEQQEKIKELHLQDGARFDQAYVEAMVKAHEKTVAMLKTEIATGRDPDTKALAQELLPNVESHLAEARRLAGKDERAASLPQQQ